MSTAAAAAAAGKTPAWASDVCAFWSSLGQAGWFHSTPELDETITSKYLPLYERLAAGPAPPADALADTSGTTALAAVLALDQFPRNMFRGTARAFASDPAALATAKAAVAAGLDADMRPDQKIFLYMPYMHAESLADQDAGLALYEHCGMPQALQFCKDHRDVVARFGRFPHRNACLGRESSAEEAEFAAGHGGWGQ